MKIIAFIFLFLILFSGCEITPENYEPEPNIYAMLSADSLHALVMVGKTAGLNDTIKIDTITDTFWYDDSNFTAWDRYVYRWNGVSGLEVSLKKDSQTLSLEGSADSAGYYQIQPVSFKSGETWKLEVLYPDKSIIEASTTFPGEFEITSPEHDTLFYEDTLAWTRPAGAGGYTISAIQWVTYWEEDTFYVDSSIEYFSYLLLPADDCFIPVYNFFYFSELGVPDSVAFLVSALDSNAYDYIYGTSFAYFYPPYDDSVDISKYMHIEGAWGVFGSQTIARSRAYGLYFFNSKP